MKRVISIVSSLSFLLCFSGCEKTDKSSSNAEITTVLTESKTDIPTEPETICVQKIPVLSAELQSWEHHEVAELFYDNPDSAEFEERDSDLINDGRSYFYNLDKHFLTVDAGNIYYHDVQKENDYWYSMLDSAWLNNDMDSLFGCDEFPDFSVKEAENMLSVYMDELKIPHLSAPAIWSVDKNEASAYFNRFGGMTDKYGNPQENLWDASNQCYIFVYHQQWNDIPFSAEGSIFVSAVVTKDEIISFHCSNVFDSISESRSMELMYSADDARQNLTSCLTSDHKSNDVAVNILDCDMVYTVDSYNGSNELVLSPQWQLKVETMIGETAYIMNYFINPETEELRG